ncbi:hypothetical protein [Marinomonas pontica]
MRNVIAFDELIDIDHEPSCCWRCKGNDVELENTECEDESIWAHFICNDCSSVYQVGYQATQIYIPEQ